MSVNVKLGNNIINGIDTVKLKDAINDSLYHSFSLPLEPNIHFSSTTAPTDTSKLWVKTDVNPTKVIIKKGAQVNETNTITSLTKIVSSVHYSGFCTIGNYIYKIGGVGDRTDYSSYYSDKVVRYDVLTGAQTTIGNIATPLYSYPNSCAAVGNTIYSFGGRMYSGGGGTTVNYIEKIELSGDTAECTQLTGIGFSSTYDTIAVAVGTNIYVFGGYNNSYIYRFDTTTDTIAKLTNTLTLGREACGWAVGTNIYLFGGYRSSTSQKTIYKFNTLTETVTLLSTELPTSTYSLWCTGVGSTIYIKDSNSGSCYKFDATSETITEITGLNYSTNDQSWGTIIDNYLYMFKESTSSSTGCEVLKWPLEMPLLENHLLILDDYGLNSFDVIKENNLNITTYVRSVYLGDSNNKAQPVTSALYDEDTQTWVNI